jgi:hypothetical protein
MVKFRMARKLLKLGIIQRVDTPGQIFVIKFVKNTAISVFSFLQAFIHYKHISQHTKSRNITLTPHIR